MMDAFCIIDYSDVCIEMMGPSAETRLFSHSRSRGAQTHATLFCRQHMTIFGEGLTATPSWRLPRQRKCHLKRSMPRFGSKIAILSEVITRAIRGDEHDTALMMQVGPQAVMAAPNNRALIAAFATHISTS